MPIPSTLLQLPPICAALGVQFVVTSPGSRSAALTLAFSAFPDLTTISVRDERVAGYVALGMALASQKPVVVICTSGTAAINLAPAVAEAYFLQVPLIVLTADRPPEWIHQYDGQTIFQERLFGSHIKRFYQWLPESSPAQDWFTRRTLSESIWLAQQAPAGPVHINVPIREPFYPAAEDYPLPFPKVAPIIGLPTASKMAEADLAVWLDQLWEAQQPVWVVGQQQDVHFSKALDQVAQYFPVIADSIGQVSPVHALCFQDAWASLLPDFLAPDWLISSDKSILSKPMKIFLRHHRASYHVHIQASTEWVDPFQSLTTWLQTSPVVIAEAILKKIADQGVPEAWSAHRTAWASWEASVREFFAAYSLEPSDARVVRSLMTQLPAETYLHGGNSMAIRYINLFYGLSAGPRVFANRGTSGIDGCLSTAVGAAWAQPDRLHVALVGDVTFWYDSNALWQTSLPSNLKVIVLNNQGGNIFHLIPGPTDQPAFKTFFQTEQHLKAKGLAESFGFAYQSHAVAEITSKDWAAFWQQPGFVLWEIHTDPLQNQEVMRRWRTDLAAFLRPSIP